MEKKGGEGGEGGEGGGEEAKDDVLSSLTRDFDVTGPRAPLVCDSSNFEINENQQTK
jgi:hypothetical protein